jgi:putative FmdB family regulatory protein
MGRETMATYDYKCKKCESLKEVSHSMKENPEVRCACGETMERVISGGLGFVLKGDGWAGKNIKQKNDQLQKRKEAGKRMALNYDIPQIVPNYNGEVCKSWDEAKLLAKEKGKVDGLVYEKQVQDLKKNQEKTKEKVNNLIKGEA